MIYLNAKDNKEVNIEEEILKLQNEIFREILLWIKEFNIEKTYSKCLADRQILTYSHRRRGFENPQYILSDNFTVELKTNFGFGSSSYFYVKFKYKNIEIIPFSEWVNFEIAKFSEIVGYTKSFSIKIFTGYYYGKRLYKKIIENSNWQDAINFIQVAGNISLKDEEDFIRKYVIDECEEMVVRLEYIYSASQFTFEGESNTHYKVDKTGHQLMELRGEKISGALDFIGKILEFEKIAEIKSFIIRIEECNKKIQPLLAVELKDIEIKLTTLNSEMSGLKPKYLILAEKNKNYIKQKDEIRTQLIATKQLNINNFDFDKLNKALADKFPELKEFEKEYAAVSKQYNALTEQIENLKKILENITTYNDKILDHFGK